MVKQIVIPITFLAIISSCGSGANLFKSFEKEDKAEQATLELEQRDPEAAIDILSGALIDEQNPSKRYQYLSLLSAAYSQLYGVDTITFALKMATNDTSSNSGNTNQITALFSVTPPATDTNIAGVAKAISLLEQIPVANRTAADNFKLAMLNTAMVGLQTKRFDADGDGQVSPVELLNLDDNAAASILASLVSAQGALSGAGGNGSNADSANSNIGGIKGAIDSESGDTDAEKLRNFLNPDN